MAYSDLIHKGFLNCLIPNPNLIKTHLEWLLADFDIQLTEQTDSFVIFRLKSPDWLKNANYDKQVKFEFVKNDKLYHITNVIEF